MSQQSKVLAHLQSRGSINSLEAITRYGITRISAVIFELRKQGHTIESVASDRADGFVEYKYNFKKSRNLLAQEQILLLKNELHVNAKHATPEALAKILTQYANKILAISFIGR